MSLNDRLISYAYLIRLDKPIGTLLLLWPATVFEQGIFIQGTGGSVKTSIYGGTMEHWQNGQMIKYPAVPTTQSIQENFRECILGRATSPSPALLGLRQARLMDAIYASAKHGQPVAVVAD